jgi:hypothetical protein
MRLCAECVWSADDNWKPFLLVGCASELGSRLVLSLKKRSRIRLTALKGGLVLRHTAVRVRWITQCWWPRARAAYAHETGRRLSVTKELVQGLHLGSHRPAVSPGAWALAATGSSVSDGPCFARTHQAVCAGFSKAECLWVAAWHGWAFRSAGWCSGMWNLDGLGFPHRYRSTPVPHELRATCCCSLPQSWPAMLRPSAGFGHAQPSSSRIPSVINTSTTSALTAAAGCSRQPGSSQVEPKRRKVVCSIDGLKPNSMYRSTLLPLFPAP